MNINDFTYNLPPEKIALYPLSKRDDAKLLFYNKGNTSHEKFTSLPALLPGNALLFFNDTKVIPARLHFQKDSGASIELFLLSPVAPSNLMLQAMEAHEQCVWKCTIGNLKRWTSGTDLVKNINGISIKAKLLSHKDGLVHFNWTGNQSFAEVINASGETPLPPYLKRDAEASDRERYQTTYSQKEGAVAAPTAGLHFTDDVFTALHNKGIATDFITLHVSAGTFQPVKAENALEHVMHSEQILVSRNNVENLMQAGKFIVPVGTTSMRTLESLYWYGAQLIHNPYSQFLITQTDPYKPHASTPGRTEALQAVLNKMDADKTDFIMGESAIYIHPGYTFKVCDGIVTNFHQPASTLILLIAAFIGKDWRAIYDEALQNDYRFLSYGDSSLLIP